MKKTGWLVPIRPVFCKRNTSHHCLFPEEITFDIYGLTLTADEATAYVNGTKASKLQVFERPLQSFET
jgi:hypothetical protein